MKYAYILCCLFVPGLFSCRQATAPDPVDRAGNTEMATFGAGCFWCTEALFQELDGVDSVIAGYAGGWAENPSYEDVSRGLTGHAEVARIIYDPAKISYDELLEVFWQTHDPTSLNSQGPDKGTQYRSVILYHNEQQRELAEQYKKELDASGAWDKPLVTEIVALESFYRAEEYHQDFYARDSSQAYCATFIKPKLDRLREVFRNKLKKK